jgi:hypothetical protein
MFFDLSSVMRLTVVSVLAVIVGGFIWGGPRLLSVGGSTTTPSPVPGPSLTTAADEGSDILARTKARPLPTQATCPPGSDPDAPGPADQERPYVEWGEAWTGAMAFDRHAGRIVLVASEDGSGNGVQVLWTYDVCTNTWRRMSSSPPPGVRTLVYDADSDRTLAFSDDRVSSYDLATERWTKGGVSFPQAGANEIFGTRFYHDPSGLVVVYDGTTMWAYDVDTDTRTEVPQRPDPVLPADSALPRGRIAFGYDPRDDLVVAVVVPFVGDDGVEKTPVRTDPGETWTFDPGTGAWRREASTAAADLIVCGLSSFPMGSTDCWETNGRAVSDEASGMVVFMKRDWGRPVAPGRVDAYDPGQGTWSTLFYDPKLPGNVRKATWCASMPPVYDPLNARIVCLGKSRDSDVAGVSAFSTATSEWRWLLEPVP